MAVSLALKKFYETSVARHEWKFLVCSVYFIQNDLKIFMFAYLSLFLNVLKTLFFISHSYTFLVAVREPLEYTF